MYVEMTSTFQRRSICIFNRYSTLIRRRKRNVETTSIFRRRSDVDYYTSKQRRYLNVETTSISQRRFHLRFQPLFDVDSTTCSDVDSTSFRRRFAGWAIVLKLSRKVEKWTGYTTKNVICRTTRLLSWAISKQL